MDRKSASRFFRLNLWLHRWTGLIATLPFLILCITGSILIFHEEIDEALGIVPSSESADAPARSLHEVAARVLKVYPDERVLSLGIDPEDHPGILLVVTNGKDSQTFEGAKLRYGNLVTGEPSSAKESEGSFTRWLLELHAQWFLGPIGEIIGAFFALLVLISLLSGLIVYAPYVKRVAFGLLRRGKSARLVQLDLHNFLGAVTLGWALIVTSTGFLLGFGTVAIGVWQMTALAELRASADQQAPVDLRELRVTPDQARDVAAKAVPDWRVQSIIYPATDYSSKRHYTVLLAGKEGAEERLLRVAIVDAETGELAAAPRVPGYIQAIFISEPLHFGDYGGLPLKLLWTVCSWFTLFITANGAWLWWDRRKLKARPAGAQELLTA